MINKLKNNNNDSIGILGSGLMGHGIAYAAAISGLQVLILDLSKSQATKGLQKIYQILEKRFKKGFITKQELDDIKNRIEVSHDYEKLKTKNIVIEAIYEDLNVKTKALKTAEGYMNPNGFIASNTSTIPISVLASKLINPQKFIGLHFFSPVHKMKLVEVIKGQKTSSETLSRAISLALKISKTPIIVNDSPGFYTTRVFVKYPFEGMAMLSEGIKASSIENAGKKAGYPVGPLALSDEVNIALIGRIRKQILKYDTKNSIGPWDKVIELMVKNLKREGRSGTGGFYDYPINQKKYIWENLEKYFPSLTKRIPEKDIIDRLIFSQILEAISCFEKKIITSVQDANIGSILGLGFPSDSGGVLQFVNNYGVLKFRDRSLQLADQYGKRFTPPKLLNEMAKTKKVFNSI
ncbi:MAG: 3-hydroxyacyl-CoA dehydrogenase family protein [Candidatus Neomarinimicrobiota bacterium]